MVYYLLYNFTSDDCMPVKALSSILHIQNIFFNVSNINPPRIDAQNRRTIHRWSTHCLRFGSNAGPGLSYVLQQRRRQLPARLPLHGNSARCKLPSHLQRPPLHEGLPRLLCVEKALQALDGSKFADRVLISILRITKSHSWGQSEVAPPEAAIEEIARSFSLYIINSQGMGL